MARESVYASSREGECGGDLRYVMQSERREMGARDIGRERLQNDRDRESIVRGASVQGVRAIWSV